MGDPQPFDPMEIKQWLSAPLIQQPVGGQVDESSLFRPNAVSFSKPQVRVTWHESIDWIQYDGSERSCHLYRISGRSQVSCDNFQAPNQVVPLRVTAISQPSSTASPMSLSSPNTSLIIPAVPELDSFVVGPYVSALIDGNDVEPEFLSTRLFDTTLLVTVSKDVETDLFTYSYELSEAPIICAYQMKRTPIERTVSSGIGDVAANKLFSVSFLLQLCPQPRFMRNLAMLSVKIPLFGLVERIDSSPNCGQVSMDSQKTTVIWSLPTSSKSIPKSGEYVLNATIQLNVADLPGQAGEGSEERFCSAFDKNNGFVRLEFEMKQTLYSPFNIGICNEPTAVKMVSQKASSMKLDKVKVVCVKSAASGKCTVWNSKGHFPGHVAETTNAIF